ncbi:MAG: glycosyltransferase [Eubacteriales bacterium]
MTFHNREELDDKRKTIGLLIDSLAGGGAEKVVSILSTELIKQYEVHVILLTCEDIKYPYAGKLSCLNFNYYKGERFLLAYVLKRVSMLKCILRLNRMIRDYSIDTTISFLPYTNVINSLSNSKNKIVTIHGHPINSASDKLINNSFYRTYLKVSSLILNRSDLIVSVSDSIRKQLTEELFVDGRKTIVLNNPVDVVRVMDMAAEPLDPETEKLFSGKTIINVASLKPNKNQEALLRIFEKVNQEVDDVNLVLVGEGPNETRLKYLVNEMGLANKVHFLGFRENPFNLMHNSTIFCMTSLSEGFGNVIIESMTCNTPVISSDCGGPREILSNDYGPRTRTEFATYGIIIPIVIIDGERHVQEDEFAEVLIRALTDKTLLDNYRNVVKDRSNDFDLGVTIAKWYEIIEHRLC